MQETSYLQKTVLETINLKKNMTPKSKQKLEEEGLTFAKRKLSVKDVKEVK